MKIKCSCIHKKIMAVILICALILCTLPQSVIAAQKKASSYGLSNPTRSNGVTTWDCIYFGNYWQEDTNRDGYADQNDDKTPIKWRVLSVEGDDVFLLADRNLCKKHYNFPNYSVGDAWLSVTWETSTLRSWLNGYDAQSNISEYDYTDDNFLNTAFSASEQAAIKTTLLNNQVGSSAYPKNQGNDTLDKVYILSIADVYNEQYGFEPIWNKTKTREAKDTAYVDSRQERGDWWLRTLGSVWSGGVAACNIGALGRIWTQGGEEMYGGNNVAYGGYAVRPALHINLSALDDTSNLVWSYAGKINSNGEEIEAELTTEEQTTEEETTEEQTTEEETTEEQTTEEETTEEQTTEEETTEEQTTEEDTTEEIENPGPKSPYPNYGLNNPMKDNTGVITWDCIYFGRYWQSDTNGDGVVDKKDAKKPIKWRVLSVEGDDAFLLADNNLTMDAYNIPNYSIDINAVTWETSTIRSWLNGYDAEANISQTHFKGIDFLGNAFTASEQAAIKDTSIVNADNAEWGTDAGNDTTDKIFLLSINEVLKPEYGFIAVNDNTKTRVAKYTDYVGGSDSAWWLRTPGQSDVYAAYIDCLGGLSSEGKAVSDFGYGIRPALHLNLAALPDHVSKQIWSYAGKITAVGKNDETSKEDEIGKKPSVSHTHIPVTDPIVAPSCTVTGKKEGSHCAECGQILKEQEVIPATGHACVRTITRATDMLDGSIAETCGICGDVVTNTPIYKASEIMLSKDTFTYNGKKRKPTVIVKDSQGVALSADSYDIIYPKTAKKIGKYTVCVVLKGNYSGLIQLKYQIVPQDTGILKLTAKKKGFTVKWKKQTKQTTGYQIQYATNKSFKGAKTITFGTNKVVSATITKLKAEKKYYVRVRTYKKVKVNGKNKKFYSGWSKAKTVNTKK